MLRKLFVLFVLVFLENRNIFHGATPLSGKNVRKAEPNEFPFIVSLSWINYYDSSPEEKYHFCGGVLITKKHVLTAAHCLRRVQNLYEIVVKVGSNDLRNTLDYEVERWITYNQWAKKDDDLKNIHDIAIIELSTYVSSGDIQLPTITKTPTNEFPGREAVIAGWGRTENNQTSRFLKTAKLKVIPFKKCYHLTRVNNSVNWKNFESFCTAIDPPVFSNCGDSGGPLIVNKNEIIGINKGRCFLGDSPLSSRTQNVHTSVNYYKPFIAEVTGMEFQTMKSKSNACTML